MSLLKKYETHIILLNLNVSCKIIHFSLALSLSHFELKTKWSDPINSRNKIIEPTVITSNC